MKTPVLDVEADPKTWQDFYFLAPGLYTAGVYTVCVCAWPCACATCLL